MTKNANNDDDRNETILEYSFIIQPRTAIRSGFIIFNFFHHRMHIYDFIKHLCSLYIKVSRTAYTIIMEVY